MAHTSSNQDKFAFLFTGSTSIAEYLKDVEEVYKLLTEYYNYLPSNIIVAEGASVFTGTFSALPPANQKIIGTKADLRTAFDYFALNMVLPNSNSVYGTTGPYRNSVLVYFTGPGRFAGQSYIVVNGTEEFDGTWFTSMLQTPFDPSYVPGPSEPDDNYMPNLRKSYVNVVIQSGEAGVLKPAVQNCTFLNQRLFIGACGIGSAAGGTEWDSATNPDGLHDFTWAWLKGLKLEEKFPVSTAVPLNDIYAAKYLDELSGVVPNIPLERSKQFAESKNNVTDYAFLNTGEVEKFLGYFEMFKIRDGDEAPTPRAWYESPDIWINNSDFPASDMDNDYYKPGSPNEIHIRINNIGTSPVRTFYIGSKIYHSGGGGDGDEHIPSAPVDILITAGKSAEYVYSYSFDDGFVHRCIIAAAGLTAFTDMSYKNPYAEADTAQRNLDAIMTKSSSGGAPDTGEAVVDETDPREDAEPEVVTGTPGNNGTTDPGTDPGNDTGNTGTGTTGQTETESRSVKNLRGFREHTYFIKNNYRLTHTFIIPPPENLKELKDIINVSFYRLYKPKDGKGERRILLLKSLKEFPVNGIPVIVGPGAEAEILMNISFLRGAKTEKELKAAFEILIVRKNLGKRVFSLLFPGFFKPAGVKFAGVTVRLKMAAGSTVTGTVIDHNKKPVGNAFVFLSTANRRQSAVVKTNKEGIYRFPDIDPDYYFVWASIDKSVSKKNTFFLKDRVTLKQDILLLK